MICLHFTRVLIVFTSFNNDKGGQCSPELWTGYDGKTCGPCAALVNVKYYGKTCSSFCEEQKMSCVAAWDDRRNERCSHFAREYSCGHFWKRTSDAICHCSKIGKLFGIFSYSLIF